MIDKIKEAADKRIEHLQNVREMMLKLIFSTILIVRFSKARILTI